MKNVNQLMDRLKEKNFFTTVVSDHTHFKIFLKNKTEIKKFKNKISKIKKMKVLRNIFFS